MTSGRLGQAPARRYRTNRQAAGRRRRAERALRTHPAGQICVLADVHCEVVAAHSTRTRGPGNLPFQALPG